MKLFIKIIAALIALTIATILCLQVDDELRPEIIDFMALSEAPDNNDAYLYLLGFSSEENSEPLSAGREIFTHIQQLQSVSASERHTLSFDNATKTPALILPSSPLICDSKEENCLHNIFNHIDQISALLQSSSVLIERYNIFSKFTDYHTLTKPDIDEPLPEYQYLITAIRLVNLEQVLRASQGQVTLAIEALYQQHDQIRLQLAIQDTLIGKLIFLRMLAESIDLIAVLANTYQFKLSVPVHSLTLDERSLATAFSREVRMMYTIYQELDGASDILNKEGGTSSPVLPSWLTYVLFKLNMSTNESYKHLRYYADLSELSIVEFINEKQQGTLRPEIQRHLLRNAIGTILTDMAGPDYSKYVTDFWDVENKIRLFNARLNNRSAEKVTNELVSIYSTDESIYPYLSKDKKQLCFDNPYGEDASYHCLRIIY